MKTLTLLLCLLFATGINAQMASRLVALQANVQGRALNFMWVDTTATVGFNRMYVAPLDSVLMNQLVIIGLKDSLLNKVTISGSYSNPPWISSLAQSKISYTGTTAQYIQGNGASVTFPTDLSSFTNSPGYLISVPAQSFSSLTGKPTTLSGYGITDATSNARSAVSLTTTGTSGASTYNSGTGVLNIPNYAVTFGTVTSIGLTSSDLSISGSPVTTSGSITANLNTSGVGAGTYSGVTVTNKGIVTAATTRSFNNAPGRSIVTVAASANGFQVSSTRDSHVSYSITITNAVQIGVVANVDGYVVLEVASTNSTTAGDWVEVGRISGAQNISLAIALASTQKSGGGITAIVPAGYYARLRSVNTSGTPTYVTNGQQEVIL